MIEAREVHRHPRNAPGRYYTSGACDGCAYCAAVAPDLFEFEKATNTYYVVRQPRTPEEEEWITEAMEDCPVDAILANGGQATFDSAASVGPR